MAEGTPDRKTALLVEDDDVTRQWMAEALRLGGHAVAAVEDGRRALERLRADPLPDVIVLDMMLAGHNGWDFLEARNADARLAGVPVVVVTASSLTREWAASHGCAGFLRKPCGPMELLAEVRRVLG
jgi:CheY-like chemotaxis protein